MKGKDPFSPLVDVAQLPRTFRDLIDMLGFANAKRLVDHSGGKQLYIPKKLTRTSVLRDLVGEELAQQMCCRYGGTTLDIPKSDCLQRQLRDREIAIASALGASRSQLVDRYGLSRRQIGNIRLRYRDYIEEITENNPEPVIPSVKRP